MKRPLVICVSLEDRAFNASCYILCHLGENIVNCVLLEQACRRLTGHSLGDPCATVFFCTQTQTNVEGSQVSSQRSTQDTFFMSRVDLCICCTNQYLITEPFQSQVRSQICSEYQTYLLRQKKNLRFITNVVVYN